MKAHAKGVNIFYGCKTYIYIWGKVKVVQEHSATKLLIYPARIYWLDTQW